MSALWRLGFASSVSPSATLDVIQPRAFMACVAVGDAPCADLIVVDGESMRDDAERELVFRAAMLHTGGLATVLYIFVRTPGEEETTLAYAFADDVLLQGWDFADRLRRRVQAIALAPWRRSMTLRQRAVMLGDRRLRVVRTGQQP